MDDANFLPNDLVQCQRLLWAAFREATQRERRLADAERKAADAERNAQVAEGRAVAAEGRASESQQQVTDLGRVLDETAASFEQLRQRHEATLEELAWYGGFMGVAVNGWQTGKAKGICSTWLHRPRKR
jgi:hypothetical protein